MPSIFTRIINGELPARFIHRDDDCVAFLTVAPIRPGHALVVPVAEVDHWLDLDPALTAHLTSVAHRIGRAQMVAFAPERIGLIIAGFEVPHVHLHVIPCWTMADVDFTTADADPSPDAMDDAAQRLVGALAALD